LDFLFRENLLETSGSREEEEIMHGFAQQGITMKTVIYLK